MKKNFIRILVAVTFVAVSLTGCGNKEAAKPSAAIEETVDSSEIVAESVEAAAVAPSDAESADLPKKEVTINPKDNITAWAAKDADLYDGYTEGAKVIGTLTQDAEVVITGTSSDAKYYEIQNGDGVAYVMVDALTSEEPLGYKVTAMEATMYAQQTVNTRKGPSSDYEKTGSLAKGQEVKIIGQADTGWYQLENGSFVTNSSTYIASSKPSDKASASNGGSTSGTGSGGGTGSTTLCKWQNADGSWNYSAMTEMWDGDIVLTNEASTYVCSTNPWNDAQWKAYNAWRDAQLDIYYGGGNPDVGYQSYTWYCDETLTAQFLEACLAYCKEDVVVAEDLANGAKTCLEGNDGHGMGQFAEVSGGTAQEAAACINTNYPHVFQSDEIGVAAGYKQSDSGDIMKVSYIVIYW